MTVQYSIRKKVGIKSKQIFSYRKQTHTKICKQSSGHHGSEGMSINILTSSLCVHMKMNY